MRVMRVERVDNSMFWNVSIGVECVGWIKVEDYKLVFKPAINAFAPQLSFTARMDALRIARNDLTNEDYKAIKCAEDLELVNYFAEFLADCGIEESEVDEQAIAMIKGLKKKWKVNKIIDLGVL